MKEYHYLKVDFWSAYNASDQDVNFALFQVSRLRNISIMQLKIYLKPLLDKITEGKK